MEIHKIFFTSFPTELNEWIAKLADSQGRWKLDSPIVWTPNLVRRLEVLEDKITHIVNNWFNHIAGGFVTKFVVDTSVNYNKAKRRFFKGLRGKYVKSLNTWIKILL